MSLSNVEQLTQVLSSTLTGNQADLRAAETFLAQCSGAEGYIPALLMVIGTETNDQKVRLSAILQLKSEVKSSWLLVDGKLRVNDNDRKIMKENIVDAIVRSSGLKKLLTQFEVILNHMVQYEYPAKWPELFPLIIERMKNANTYPEIIGMLIAYKSIIKKYEFLMGKDRRPIEEHIQAGLPILETILTAFLNGYDEGAANATHEILKIFYATIVCEYNTYLMDQGNLRTWMTIVRTVLTREIPNELETLTGEEKEIITRENNVFWKNRKWCARIMEKFMQRYANKKWELPETRGLWSHLQEVYVPSFLEVFLELLARKRTSYVSPKTVYLGFKYLFYSLKMPAASKAIYEHLETILFDISLPSTMLTRRDEDVWKNDPQEFVRREEDYTYIGSSSKNAAMEFVEEICDRKEEVLMKVADYIGLYLNTGKEPRNGAPLEMIVKESLLFVLCHLRKQVIRTPKLFSSMEPFIERFVLCELNSQVGFLRARACDFICRFGSAEFANKDNIKIAMEGICQALLDAELPVRIKAAMALATLISQKDAFELLKPNLKYALQEYLKLMDAVDNDQVVIALEEMVDLFHEEISPFALDLVVHLTNAFFKYHGTESGNAQAEDESIEDTKGPDCEVSAASCLVTIRRIIIARLPQPLFQSLEEVLAPVFDFAFSEEGVEYLEEAAELLNILLYNLPTFSEKVWSYYPTLAYIVGGRPPALNERVDRRPLSREKLELLAEAEKGWGYEYITQLLGCFQNYIGKCKPLFLQGKDEFGTSFVELLFRVIDRIVEVGLEKEDDVDMICVCTLYVCLLENYQGHLDDFIPFIFERCLGYLRTERSDKFKAIAVEVIAMGIWYNPRLAIVILEQKSALQFFFESWYTLLPSFRYDFDKKRILLGLSSLFQIPVGELPQLIISALENLMREMYKLTNEILAIREKDESSIEEEALEDKEAEDLKEVEGPFDTNGKSPFMDKDEYKRQQAVKAASGEEDEDEDDEDDSDFEEDNEVLSGGGALLYESPLEKVDEIVFFGETLEAIKASVPAFYEQLLSALSPDDRAQLYRNFHTSHEQHTDRMRKQAEDRATTSVA